jgi:hypothetical protein
MGFPDAILARTPAFTRSQMMPRSNSATDIRILRKRSAAGFDFSVEIPCDVKKMGTFIVFGSDKS